MFAFWIALVTYGLPPDQARSGRPSWARMLMSLVRADRIGPTGSACDDWKTAANRVMPSTISSKTTSAWLMPTCGRAIVGKLSIFTTSAGRAAAVVVVAGSVVEVEVDVDGSAVVEPEAAPAPLLHADSASPPAAARTRR